MTEEAVIDVVRRAQQGETRAFDLLVRRFQHVAVAYARTLLPDPSAAEDAAQEAFVQAWRDLPRLREPGTFGSWLRRLVFKFCDRARRSARPTLPLTEALPLSDDQGPASVVERADEAGRVWAAVEGLPGPLREATVLYYLTGHDVGEIADFLAVPPSTVKNRLHTARKRLRKELWTVAETSLENLEPEKATRNEAFAEGVLARVLEEFQRQEAADPHTADRGLLEEGKTALFQRLRQEGSLDEPSLRDGFTLLWRKRDWAGLSALLMRSLTHPLSDSWAAWAYLHLANVIDASGSAAGAVLAHEAFERWMPGKSLRLFARWPYYPAPEDALGVVYNADEVRLLFLSQSGEFATSYLGVCRNSDYLVKMDAARVATPVSPQNRMLHFYALRMAATACEVAGDLEAAQGYIQLMSDLAAGAEDEARRDDLRVRALGHEMELARRRQDEAGWEARAAELMALLDNAKARDGAEAEWIRSERHNLACGLADNDRHDLALPLWEANAASGGQVGGWGWLMYAVTVWQLTQDRERTLALLREARAHDDRDMVPLFTERCEFGDVRDDPEFLLAIGRQQAAV